MTARAPLIRRRPIPRLTELRRHKRVAIELSARLLIGGAVEATGRVINMSAGGMLVETEVEAEVGQPVIAYIDEIGRVEGNIRRVSGRQLGVALKLSIARRERIVEALIFLINRDIPGIEEQRGYPRVTRTYATRLVLEDGTEYDCTVLDISLNGVGLAVSPRPPLGTLCAVGRMRGRIIRHFETGVGVQFLMGCDQARPAAE